VGRTALRWQHGPDRRALPLGRAEQPRCAPIVALVNPHACQHIEALGEKEPTPELSRDHERLIEGLMRRGHRSPLAPRVGLPSEDLGEMRGVTPTHERDALSVQQLSACGIAGVAPKVAGDPKGESRRKQKPVRAKGWEPGVE